MTTGMTPRISRLEAGALSLAAVLSVAIPVLAFADISLPGRAVLAVAFVVIVPGVALSLLLRCRVPMVTVTLAIALSIAAHLLAATGIVLLEAPLELVPVALAAVNLAVTGWLCRRGITIIRGHQTEAADSRWRYGSLLLLAAALGLWWWETHVIDLDAAGPRGLIAEVSWRIGLASAIVAFVLAVAFVRRLDRVVLLAALGSFMTIAYLLVNVADGTGGFSTGWVHVGFIDYISSHGAAAEGIDARFSWPGFFALGSVLTWTAGLTDATPLLVTAPLVMNVLLVPALYLIGRSVTGSARLAWAGVVIYQVFNWFHQDYFAPQATATLLYASIVGLLLWQLFGATVPTSSRRGIGALIDTVRRVPGRVPGSGPLSTMGLYIIGLVLAAAMIVSHQLTPVVLIMVLLGFTLCGAIRARGAWLVVGLLFVAWFSYAATDYWVGHLSVVLGDMGEVGQTVSSGVVDRIGVEPTYQSMQQLRMGWSALYGFLGALGLAVLVLRRRRFTIVLAGLIAAPFTLVALQSYGGEVFLRCFVYAAPILAPLVAIALHAALRPVADHISRSPYRRFLLIGAVALLSGLLCAATLLLTATRGLNVSFERVTTTHDLAASQILTQAENGDSVAQLGALGALGAGRVGDIDRDDIALFQCTDPDGPGGEPIGSVPMDEAVACLLDESPDWIYVTSTQLNALHLEQGTNSAWVWQMLRNLADTDEYELILDAEDVTVLHHRTEEQ